MEEVELLLVILDNEYSRWDIIKEIDTFISAKYKNKVSIRKTFKIK